MDTLIGVAGFFAVILFFSAFLTFFEFLDRLESGKKGEKVQILSLFKYWPISIWAIYWNGIKNEMVYGRLILPPSQEKKGGKIEE